MRKSIIENLELDLSKARLERNDLYWELRKVRANAEHQERVIKEYQKVVAEIEKEKADIQQTLNSVYGKDNYKQIQFSKLVSKQLSEYRYIILPWYSNIEHSVTYYILVKDTGRYYSICENDYNNINQLEHLITLVKSYINQDINYR